MAPRHFSLSFKDSKQKVQQEKNIKEMFNMFKKIAGVQLSLLTGGIDRQNSCQSSRDYYH